MRRDLIAALCAGAIVGLAGWLALDRGGGEQARLEAVKARLTGVRPAPDHGGAGGAGGGGPMNPLFNLTAGPSAVIEPTLRLDGVARTPRGAAALVSINGGAGDWLKLGESRDGVTLREVAPGEAVFDTPTQLRTVHVGDRPPVAPASVGAPPAPPVAVPQPHR